MKPGKIILLVITACLILVGLAAAARKSLGPGAFRLTDKIELVRSRVAILPLYGEIQDSDWTIRWLRRFGKDVRGVKAIVIALDTPGGRVAPSQEICQAIYRLRKDSDIKIVAAMGDMAASGGYYIASACDEIVADPGTLTGSIGVIMEFPHAERLFEKIGAKFETVKSGEFKDSGSPFREMGARERRLFQGVIDDVYDQFVEDVSSGRHDALADALARQSGRKAESYDEKEIKAYVKTLADGRVYTGRQAYDLGLVDTLGGLNDAIDEAAALADIKDPEVITLREPKSFAEMMTGMTRAQMLSFMRQAFSASAPKMSLSLH